MLKRPSSGFTLVELIVVMVIIGIIAGVLTMFFGPAVQNYLASGRRAALTDQADGAMRRMMRELRSAVPNSVRSLNTSLEFAPSTMGGRYRTAPDIGWDMAHGPSNQSMPLDTNVAVTTFDVLTPMPTLPSVGDRVIIGNQSADQLYGANGAATISAAARPPAATAALAPLRTLGTARLTLAPAHQFPPGYDGGRFFVVSGSQQAVSFVCFNPGMQNGSGRGILFRVTGYSFNSVQLVPPITTGAILARNVESCAFDYLPGSTMEGGYVEISLTLNDSGESVSLTYGAHVANVP
ncbi:prepilin-type N-terminal cleavage/methylation domain-containing protein [Massilia sp. SR12]